MHTGFRVLSSRGVSSGTVNSDLFTSSAIHTLYKILFLKSSSFWSVWAKKKKWTALHFGSLNCPFISCFQNKCTSTGCLNKINNSLAALIVFLRMHWRLIFGNVTRCSTLRLRVSHFIYSKFTAVLFYLCF